MSSAPVVRERQVNVRLSEEEAERLEFVCRHYGLNGANLFRMLVRREEEKIRREQQPPSALAEPRTPPTPKPKPRGKR
jgi:hypothetical protein